MGDSIRFSLCAAALGASLWCCGLQQVAAAGDSATIVVPHAVGSAGSHDGIGYILPAGWTAQENAPGAAGTTILSHAPADPSQGPCEMWLLKPIPAQADLASEGVALVTALGLTGRDGPYEGNLGKTVMDSREEGVSGTGWSYADLSGQLGTSGITVRVLMVRMGGNQVFPVIGITKTWDCLGNQAVRDNDVWALFFHSLKIPGYDSDSPKLAEELPGSWTSISGGAGANLRFSKYGRYSSVSDYQTYSASSSGVIWESNRFWNGDGPYTVHGDRLHTENPHGSETERNATRFFSIVRMPDSSQASGYKQVLRIVERSYNGSQTFGFSKSGNFVLSLRQDPQP
jgi:hypothetical protein